MVSPWMVQGNINEFVKMNTNADRLELVCFFVHGPYPHLSLTMPQLPQVGDVARGLIYMHGQGIVHGDLRGVRF